MLKNSDDPENDSETLSENEILETTVTKEDIDQFRRSDQFLSERFPLTRTFIKKLFDENLIDAVSSHGAPFKLSLKKMAPVGTKITIMVPPPISMDANAEEIPLDILYEDEHLLFVNKPAGLVVHPAPGNYSGTLVNAILHHCPDLKGIGGVQRPGIVHRLDKGTSGVMVVAKTQNCHERLVVLFSKHDLERKYECLTMPRDIPASGTLKSTIGRHPKQRQKMAANVPQGREAITHYKLLMRTQFLNHMELKLETGRTHQIRVHLSSLLNCPILMDPTYGNPSNHLKVIKSEASDLLKNYPYPLLHAKSLGFIHPITEKKLSFEVPPPPLFQEILNLHLK